ncbi:MAG: endonuclease/exonuclease/phosphatase family protein [Bacteroidota bacterium]
MNYVAAGLGIFCIISTVMPFIKWGHWSIRMFDFPHVQLTVLTGMTIVCCIFLLRFKENWTFFLTGSLFIAFLYQIYIIYPYTPLAATRVEANNTPSEVSTFSILACNVLIDNKSTLALRELIYEKNPDIIALLEPNQRWVDDLEDLIAQYPYSVLEPLENTYGMILLSKLELQDAAVHHIVREDVPSIFAKAKIPSGQWIHLYCLHPEPPTPEYGTFSDERDAELLQVAKHHIDGKQPTVVFGDLNDVAWSRTTRLFQKMSGLLDPRVGRGTFNTFHADYKILRWPLDHIFHSNHFYLVSIERLSHIGSDHFPMYIELEYKKEAKIEQDRPVPDTQEKEEAKEIIEQVDLLEKKQPVDAEQ